MNLIVPGTLSDADAKLLSVPFSREQVGLPCTGGKLNEAHLQQSERRGTWPPVIDEPEDRPVTHGRLIVVGRRSNQVFQGLALAVCLMMAALAVLLAGMVVGHLVLLPTATVWPLGVASLLCAGLSIGGGIAVLRGVA